MGALGGNSQGDPALYSGWLHPKSNGHSGHAEFFADLSGTRQFPVTGKVKLRGVVNNQNQRMLRHGPSRVVPMRLQHRLVARLVLVTQVVEAPQLISVENLCERLFRVGRNLGRRVDQAPRAPPITQLRRPKVLLGPSTYIGNAIHDNLVLP